MERKERIKRKLFRDENGTLRIPLYKGSWSRAQKEQVWLRLYEKGQALAEDVIRWICDIEDLEPFTEDELIEWMRNQGWCV